MLSDRNRRGALRIFADALFPFANDPLERIATGSTIDADRNFFISRVFSR
jgi:hypothetical protein